MRNVEIFKGWISQPHDNGCGELMVTIPKEVADAMLAEYESLELLHCDVMRRLIDK